MTDRAVFSRPEWQTFARAITAAPADDLPRLVAADWLRDRGTGETIADEATAPRRRGPPRTARRPASWNRGTKATMRTYVGDDEP